ncbi:hypothetical protein niasHT_039916 [Heterodera trifolii]|uniref:F-box domain-containing protein n=1 Tax=Heterodera trifolii TaxID=157864 RepID=A0ABD2IEL0_9BILA
MTPDGKRRSARIAANEKSLSTPASTSATRPNARQKKKQQKKKPIFISADCWLAVFHLLTPFQLGLGIAMISRRFDYYVDEHFKTRKWSLGDIRIKRKIDENGTKEMEIIRNSDKKSLPIPQIQLPRKVNGLGALFIDFIDRNTIAFLHRLRPLFTLCSINLVIETGNDPIMELILRNIWPMIAKNICGMRLSADTFHNFRKFVPSILNDCPSLRSVSFWRFETLLAEFPAIDSAMASDGQALAKWLLTPRPDNLPKVLRCIPHKCPGNLLLHIGAFKEAFANASSPVNFIVVFVFGRRYSSSVAPFGLTNELTREQLAWKRKPSACGSRCFLLVRCPIARDASKWAKWEEEASGWHFFEGKWHRLFISMMRTTPGDGLLDATPGPSDQQQK